MSIFIRSVSFQNKTCNVLIQGNRISYIGADEKEAEIVIDGSGKAILPTLVNGHTHAAMTLLRGYADDMLLQPWLEQKIWPLEAKLNREDVYWGARLACIEMLRSGVTLFNDMYWFPEGTIQAAQETGIRAVVGGPLLDFFDETKAQEQQESQIKFFDENKELGDLIQLSLSPHAIYTVSASSLQWAFEFARDKGLLYHIHLSETKKEVDDCISMHGKTPAQYLYDLGVLGPNTLLAHSVWLSSDELDLIAKTGARVVHNPTANLKLSVGQMINYPEIQKRNIPICLGTDGCASNNNLDMLEEMKFAALLQKFIHNNPELLPCKDTWEITSRNAFSLFGVDAGQIEVGKLADLMLVDLNNPQMIPCYNIISNMVYSGSSEVVTDVICNGQLVMKDRYVKGQEEVFAKVGEIASRFAS